MPLELPEGEAPYTDVERNLIDLEPPGLFPTNQDSLWGTVRKVFADYIQTILDQLDTFWLNMSPSTVDANDMPEWEYELGSPVDIGTHTLEQRRSFILSRLIYGAFTRLRRATVIESFITATFGPVVQLTPDGVPLIADGISLHSEASVVEGSYRVVEDVEGFHYDVRIIDTIDVDQPGIERELGRMTPAGIDFDILSVHDPNMDQTGVLTMSGNEITDAVREAGIEGDGRAPEGSIAIYEGTTNLCSNSGFETNTNGWSAGSGTIARDPASWKKFGTACGLVTEPASTTSGAFYGGAISGATAGRVFSVGGWVYLEPGNPLIGKKIRVYNRGFRGTNPADDKTQDYILQEGEQFVSCENHVLVQNDCTLLQIFFWMVEPPAVEYHFRIDGIQIEEKPISTPLKATNGITASRGSSRVQASASLINLERAWIVARLRMGWPADGAPTNAPRLIDWHGAGNNTIRIEFAQAPKNWILERNDDDIQTPAGTAVQTFVKGDLVTVIGAWDAAQVKISADGDEFSVANNAIAPLGLPVTFDIGSFSGGDLRTIDSTLFYFACGVGTVDSLDPAVIHAIFESGREPLFIDFPEDAQVTAIMTMEDANFYEPLS